MGWQAVPLARVEVVEGRAEISSANSSADLAAGQSGTVSTALPAPVLDSSPSSRPGVLVESLTTTESRARISTQLVQSQNGLVVETTFVNIPLRQVLSTVADVHPSHIELDGALGAAPSVNAGCTGAGRHCGSRVGRRSRLCRVELPEANAHRNHGTGRSGSGCFPADCSGQRLAAHHGGRRKFLRLLKGSGVRLSVLSKALLDSVGTPMEPSSVDWALGDFELHDVFTGKAPLRF